MIFLKNSHQRTAISAVNTPKINVCKYIVERDQSLKKRKTGKYRNFCINDCIVSIAAKAK